LLGRIAGEVEEDAAVRNIPFCLEEYTSLPRGIYLSAVRNIPRRRKVYTFCSKGIYYSAEGYILFASRVYTLLQDGIFLFRGDFLRAQIKRGEKTQKGLSLSFRRRESPWCKVQ